MKFRIPLIAALYVVSPASLSATDEDYRSVVEERSYADPPTGDFGSNGIITPLDQEMRHCYIRICDQHTLISKEKFYRTWMEKAGTDQPGERNPVGDLHIGGLLAEPAGRQLDRAVLDALGREEEALAPHALSANELAPERQRPATEGLDVEDLLDLLTNDERLRWRG